MASAQEGLKGLNLVHPRVTSKVGQRLEHCLDLALAPCCCVLGRSSWRQTTGADACRRRLVAKGRLELAAPVAVHEAADHGHPVQTPYQPATCGERRRRRGGGGGGGGGGGFIRIQRFYTDLSARQTVREQERESKSERAREREGEKYLRERQQIRVHTRVQHTCT